MGRVIDLVMHRRLSFRSGNARLGALLVLLSLGACASGATPGAMTVPVSEQTLLSPSSRLRQAVQLGEVGGGRETNPLWTSQVASSDFAAALRQSLATHAMLAINNQTFRLDATLVGLEQPLAGFDLEVRSRVRYRLADAASGAVVFDREVPASYTAPFSSSFYAVERLRLANEGAVKENIRLFLAALIAEEARNPVAYGASPPPAIATTPAPAAVPVRGTVPRAAPARQQLY
jgi:hypothetical protein